MNKNSALTAEINFQSAVTSAQDYIENFDILETINNVGNDEVFTPVKTCQKILDSLPKEVWINPNFKWLNPSDKNGIFLREIALRLDQGLQFWELNKEKRRKHILTNMLYSFGLTKFTSMVARRTVYYCSVANKSFDGLKDENNNSVNGFAIGNGSWFTDNEGNIKTPKAEHSFDNSNKCLFCGISKDSKYTSTTQVEHYAYEFLHTDNIQQHVKKVFFGGNNMKFDVIIGNPPYQLSDGGAKASAKPLYHLFINQALKLNPRYLSMIIPSRWMAGGKGLDEFREKIINDHHFVEFHDYLNHEECFPNTNITGGVCYFLWDSEHNGKCNFFSHREDGEVVKSVRFLNEGNYGILIRDQLQQSILTKVISKDLNSFAEIVSSRKPFGLPGDFIKNPEKYGYPKITSPKLTGLKILSYDSGKRVVDEVSSDYPIKQGVEFIKKWKIFINEAYGDGILGNPIPTRILGTPQIGEPNEICTETFLLIGPFKTKKDCELTISYMRTKFFRFILGIKKVSQHITKSVYEFVPIMNLETEITDKYLYKFFNLNKVEIDYIERLIQDVEW